MWYFFLWVFLLRALEYFKKKSCHLNFHDLLQHWYVQRLQTNNTHSYLLIPNVSGRQVYHSLVQNSCCLYFKFYSPCYKECSFIYKVTIIFMFEFGNFFFRLAEMRICNNFFLVIVNCLDVKKATKRDWTESIEEVWSVYLH